LVKEDNMSKRHWRMCLAVAVACAPLLGTATSLAVQGDKDKVHDVRVGAGLKIESKLAADDKKDTVRTGSYAKLYRVNLMEGKKYTIRMNADGGAIDAYLRLEDPDGKQLAANDDAPGEMTLNSRIDFECKKTGAYRIICTSLNSDATGDFVFLVKQE